MRARVSTIGAFALAIIGLGASIASLADYLGPAPTFCAEGGCATVRASAWAHPLGIPMPVLGIAFYAVMIGLAFVARPRLRLALAIAGGAWAVVLIALQAFVIGAWCKLCMIADPAAIVLAACVIAGARTIELRWRALASVPALAAVIGALALWSHAAPPPPLPPGTPEFVVREQVPGAVTVVEVVDFECPYCRKTVQDLAQATTQANVPVHLVRKMMPLPRHAGAVPAALAYCCADAQGHGEAMAHELFTAPPESLTYAGCEQLAAKVGCDVERYRRELPLMIARVARESIEARSAGVSSLPTLYLGGEQIVGATKNAKELAAMLISSPRSRP